jgi:hypothetical protein
MDMAFKGYFESRVDMKLFMHAIFVFLGGVPLILVEQCLNAQFWSALIISK